HRPLAAVLNSVGHPRLASEGPRVPRQIRDRAGGPAAPATIRQPRQLQPAAEDTPDFPGGALLPLLQPPQEAPLGPVSGVEGQPGEADAVGRRLIEQVEGDLPLGAVAQRLGDAGPLAARPVGGPRLGQVQVAVEQAVEIQGSVAEVDGDDAVVDLAAGPAVLPLDAGGLVALLGAAG